MNFVDIILLILIGLVLFFAIRHVWRNKGGCSCGIGGSSCSGCSSCSGGASCSKCSGCSHSQTASSIRK